MLNHVPRWGTDLATVICIITLWAASDISWWWFAGIVLIGTALNVCDARWSHEARDKRELARWLDRLPDGGPDAEAV